MCSQYHFLVTENLQGSFFRCLKKRCSDCRGVFFRRAAPFFHVMKTWNSTATFLSCHENLEQYCYFSFMSWKLGTVLLLFFHVMKTWNSTATFLLPFPMVVLISLRLNLFKFISSFPAVPPNSLETMLSLAKAFRKAKKK